MDEKKILNQVLNNRHEAESYLTSSSFYDEWESWYDMYRGIPDKKPYTWMSNKFIPMTFSKVETAYANIMGMLFATNPPFEVEPREDGDAKQAEIMKYLLQYQFEEANIYYEFGNFVKALLIYGTGIGKVIQETKGGRKTKWVQEREPIKTLFGLQIGERLKGYVPKTEDVELYSCPRFMNISLGDIFVDPQAEDIESAGFVIHRTRRTRDYLLHMHKNYPKSYNAKILEITDEDGTESQEAKETLNQGVGRLTEPAISRPEKTPLIELLEWWGDYDIEGRGLEPCIFTVASGKHLIRAEKNPYWHGKKPFIRGTYICPPNDFYGIGIPEILEDIQVTLNENFNQRNDNLSFGLNKPVLFKRGAGITPANLVFKPGGKYGTDEEIDSSLKFIDVPDVTRSNFVHQADLERWSQEATAITSLTMGLQTTGGGKTATEAGIRQSATGTRLGISAKIIERVSFQELIKMFYQLDYQFITHPEVIKITGSKGLEYVKVTPEAVRRDYDFKVTGVFSSENKTQKSLRLIQFYNITKGNPMLKEDEILKKIYTTLEIGDDPEEILRSPEEMAIVQQNMQMAALTEKLGGGGGGSPINIPGMGGEMPGVPGVPPPVPSVPPGQRV